MSGEEVGYVPIIINHKFDQVFIILAHLIFTFENSMLEIFYVK